MSVSLFVWKSIGLAICATPINLQLSAFQIPIVPKVAPRPERSSNSSSSDPNQNNCLSPPPLLPHNVPPEQINNFVYASPQDRLVMDFGEIKLDLDHQRPSVASGSAATLPPRPLSQQSSASSSSTSTSGLLKRVRRTIAPTLNRARRKSASSSADNAR